MNIFYSWQSDTPSKIGKIFIREALDSALEILNETMGLEEAERPAIDQDTQGVMGSPAIADTIFEKIRGAEVVIADVTLVGKVDQGKKLINSNVGIELGFALGHHGDHVMLAVMNTHYGSPDDLPFDLNHRRWPVCFELSPNAAKPVRKKVRDDLAKEFGKILKAYIENGQTPPEIYEPISSTDNSAMYWRDGEYLVDQTLSAESNANPWQLGYTSDQPLIYLRMWPDFPLENLSGKDINDLRQKGIRPLLERGGGGWFDRNKHGAIVYSGGNRGYLIATTQVFKNREIWGVDGFLLSGRSRSQEFGIDFDFVPIAAFEQGILQSLRSYLSICAELGYPKCVHIEVGMVNIEGFKLCLSSDWGGEFSEPIFEDILIKTTVCQGDTSSFDLATSQIFEKVYDAAGIERPLRTS